MKINEIKINLDKFKVMKDETILKNMKEIQAFLKFINYNKKFIKNFFKKKLLLINFIEKNKV